MDSKGRATDNAIVERFFRTIKQECTYLNPTNQVNELKQNIKDYSQYYNHQGINQNKPIGLYQNKITTSTNFLKNIIFGLTIWVYYRTTKMFHS